MCVCVWVYMYNLRDNHSFSSTSNCMVSQRCLGGKFAQNLCKTYWNLTTVLIKVSITASTPFQTTYSSPIPRLFEFPFGISKTTVHPSSLRIDPVFLYSDEILVYLVYFIGLQQHTPLLTRENSHMQSMKLMYSMVSTPHPPTHTHQLHINKSHKYKIIRK